MSLNPVLKRLIKQAYIHGFGELHTFDEDKIRQYLTHPKMNLEVSPYRDFKTEEGITLRCYEPKRTDSARPAVVFISATAFVLDRLGASNEYCTLMANALNMKVINIQHRLAPEYKFPIFLNDCIDGIIWINKNASRLGVQPDKLALWGESSGASFAASATHVLRDRNLSLIKHLTLFYPLVDLINTYPSKEKYSNGYMLDRSFMDWLDERAFYPEEDRGAALASPLLNTNFSHLPPATIITAYYDPLRDEGEEYVRRLRQANIPVAHKRYEDMIHGFMRFYGKIQTAHDAFEFACTNLKQMLLSEPAC